jgi:hypothetical protein
VGAAYVFRRVGAEKWVQEAKLLADLPGANDRMGSCVAIWGNYSLVGAPGSDDESGTAYLYKYTGDSQVGRWDLAQKLTSNAWAREPGAAFGSQVPASRCICGHVWICNAVWAPVASLLQVTITSEFIAIAAPGHANASGAVYVFWKLHGRFVAAQEITSPIVQAGARFGCSIDADSRSLVVGACDLSDNVSHLER